LKRHLAEVSFLFIGKTNDDALDADLDRWPVFIIKIAAAVEIVLIDDRTSSKSLWAEDKVDRLQDGGFAAVVVAYERCVTPDEKLAGCDAAEVLDAKACDAHHASPKTRCDPPA